MTERIVDQNLRSTDGKMGLVEGLIDIYHEFWADERERLQAMDAKRLFREVREACAIVRFGNKIILGGLGTSLLGKTMGYCLENRSRGGWRDKVGLAVLRNINLGGLALLALGVATHLVGQELWQLANKELKSRDIGERQ